MPADKLVDRSGVAGSKPALNSVAIRYAEWREAANIPKLKEVELTMYRDIENYDDGFDNTPYRAPERTAYRRIKDYSGKHFKA